jgi:hypothetical protein
MRRRTSEAMLSRWPIKKRGNKARPQEVSAVYAANGGLEQMPVRHRKRFHRFELILMYLAPAFLPKLGPFFVRSSVGGDPDLRQMPLQSEFVRCPSKYRISSNGNQRSPRWEYRQEP